MNFFWIREDPRTNGVYYGIDAPDFGSHAAGQIMTITAPVSDSTLSFLKSTKQLLIGGQWVESINGATFPTVDPATEQEICDVAHGSADDVDLAVEAARRE